MVGAGVARGIARSVGSSAPDIGRYQHSACASIEIFGKGHILVLCTNPKCPNKGANWALQEKLTQPNVFGARICLIHWSRFWLMS